MGGCRPQRRAHSRDVIPDVRYLRCSSAELDYVEPQQAHAGKVSGMRSLEVSYPMYVISVAPLHSTTWSHTEDMLEKGLVRACRPPMYGRLICVRHAYPAASSLGAAYDVADNEASFDNSWQRKSSQVLR